MANLPLNHKCAVCGQRYYWCDSCARSKGLAPWKSDVCSEECRDVLAGYKQYTVGEIGEEELRDILLVNNFKGKQVIPQIQELFDKLTADPEPEVAEVELAPPEPELPLVEEAGRWEEEDLGYQEKPETTDTGYFGKRNRKNKSSK